MDEELKQKILVSVIAFNLTVLIYQLLLNSNPFTVGGLLLGLLLGAVVGGVTFGVMGFLQNR